MATIANVRKFLVALGAALAVSVTALSDGHLSASEVIAIVVVFGGAYGVWQIPNTPATAVVEDGEA